jgi:hypothetical protein
MPLLRRTSCIAAAIILVASAGPAFASKSIGAYPNVPEPMVFDMMRPLGARQGELEANTLATAPLSGPDGKIAWAPEVEYAVVDGFAVEAELPFEGGRLAELKLGLQGALGTFNAGRSAHGVQYLGIYDRHSHRYSSSLAYMLVHRFNARWSNVAMAGLWDIGLGRKTHRNRAILNNTSFYNAAEGTVLGLEVNYLGGEEGHVLVMPQLHQKLASRVNVQIGLGGHRPRGDVVRPKGGVRLIREF